MNVFHAVRSIAVAGIFLLPACVVRLNDRNEPLPNGGVTGPVLDCSTATPLGRGAPGGEAKTKFVGRFDFKTDPARPAFDWSGNHMSARFNGSEVTWGVAAVPDEDGKIGLPPDNVYDVVIDDGPPQEVILPDYSSGEPRLSVTHRLPAGEHEITVYRSSEALFGVVKWEPFTFPGGTQLPPTRRPRRIEYIGDSITCGYGNEGTNATCPYDVAVRHVDDGNGGKAPVKIPRSENIVLAYGTLAAKALDADAQTLCFSGKGVVLNYREQGAGNGPVDPDAAPDPDAKTTIPQYYERIFASEPPTLAQPNKWDFSPANDPEPQVVFINLGTNDFARDLDQDSVADGIDQPRFRQGYLDFVRVVRSRRPNAEIFLALPPMITDKFPLDNARTDFRNILRGIVDELNASGDTKVYFVELVEMGVRYGLGCDYHPNLDVHRIMADQVIGAIRSKTCW